MDPCPKKSITGKAMLLVCLAASPLAQAATVGYWRFENSSDLGADSGSNGLSLTNINTTPSVASPFSNPIPQTGAANSLTGDFEQSSSQSFSRADSGIFNFDDFTIEAYIRLESLDGSNPRVIASQLNTGTGASVAWQFGVTGTGSMIGNAVPFLQVSGDGTSLVNLGMAGNTLAINTNYYLAASVDFSVSGVTAIFYLQNLSVNGSLTNLSVSSASPTGGMFDSTANFAIGTSYNNNVRSRFFDGLIDEVRLSDNALPQGELLASVPETSSAGLIVAAALLLGTGRRRVR